MQEKNTTGLTDKDPLEPGLLQPYLDQFAPAIGKILEISRYTGGYSNLTYCLQTAEKAYVLRMPPVGAQIKTAHDMDREYRVLSMLKPLYAKIPSPLLFCDSPDVLGAPFYIMEKMNGIILRASRAPGMNIPAPVFRALSASFIDNLVALHALDIQSTGLIGLGKPEGYTTRQVTGWVKRYFTAETDTIPDINAVAQWLQEQQPLPQAPAFLHNDYKYDNLLLNPDNLTEITAVLDWEMATVGDPLMDLGASLAYWFEADEGEVFRHYNLSWLPGNFTRQELIGRYAEKSGRDLRDILFYYVFGLFKNAVIAQQIYHRWKQGHSSDARFGALLPMIQLLGRKAADTIQKRSL
ncbi:MAG: phosphotransferase family protein [Bacteroidota bacterium]|nr:phosphotransferase family protein [Bacteroidota bacterium]